jgi:phytoene dehydrogenase-like protein
MSHDAIVIGAGHNGLVAANNLADRGWDVVVFEAQDEPGGAVRSAEILGPGYVSDLFSAFYPFGYASPAIKALDLESHGLVWRRSQGAVAHPDAEGRCALISVDLEETMASFDAFAPGDGEAWRELYGLFQRVGPGIVDAMLTPFPPVKASVKVLRGLGFSPQEVVEFLRFALLPVRRLADETFKGEGGGWVLASNALHADVTPEMNFSGMFGWLLCSLGQMVGYPVPEGGAGKLTEAMVRRLESKGGRVVCGTHVDEVLVRGGRAAGVRLAGGDEVGARHVLADTSAHALFGDLLPADAVPRRVLDDLEKVHLDNATVKVDWALDKPIAWTAPLARTSGTVHVAEGMDGLTTAHSQLAMQRVPEHPFLILGQYSMVDPTRCPPGTEVAWAYTHVPHGTMRTPGELEAFVERMEDEVERLAPGFKSSVTARSHMGPLDLQAADENLVDGAVNNGTAQLHQQLVFRPFPGMGRPETAVPGVYLASAAAHPGGGVHGGPGANAARAAVVHDRAGRLRRRVRLGGVQG